MNRYKIEIRNSPNWKNFRAATLGVSITNPNWQGEKFAAILDFAGKRFQTIRIDITDALYRHNFMAKGLCAETALLQANALGALWLTQNQDVIESCPSSVQTIRWADWYKHPEYVETLTAFKELYETNDAFHKTVESDIDNFCNRRKDRCNSNERKYSKAFILEEAAILTIQARALPSVRLYPGRELNCLNVIRKGMIKEAPSGLEYEQFARIRIETRKAYRVPLETKLNPSFADGYYGPKCCAAM